MSHEIRTPMNGMIGTLELLTDTKLTLEQQKYAQTILYSGESLLDILNDILDYSKIEAGHIALSYRAIDLAKLGDDVVHLMRARAQNKSLQLNFEKRGSIENWRLADLGKLRQILINLINNAIKFTQRGSIVLSIAVNDENITGDSEVTFSVTDTGCGIAKEKQADVFQAFTQIDNLQSAVGTGLGLAICQRLVSAMQGTLSLESEENRGSCFTFTIPLVRASTEAINAQQVLFSPSQALSQRYQVLIVEDNEINLEVACALVEKLGHKVIAAKDGASALKCMHNNRFDLALLDINLPDIDGVVLSQQLKVIAKEKQTPFKTIAVSAHVFNEDITKFIKSGFDGFVAKPVQMKKLKPSIAKVMSNIEGLINQRIDTEVEQRFEIVEALVPADKDSRVESQELSNFVLFDASIPNQDIEYLGSDKVMQLIQLFCQQLNSEYSDFSSLSAIAQQAKLHKLKGAAIGLGLIRLYQLCQTLEINTAENKLHSSQLLMIEELVQLSNESLQQYAQTLTCI